MAGLCEAGSFFDLLFKSESRAPSPGLTATLSRRERGFGISSVFSVSPWFVLFCPIHPLALRPAAERTEATGLGYRNKKTVAIA